jgi:crotonobetainyl-CoA hydratase
VSGRVAEFVFDGRDAADLARMRAAAESDAEVRAALVRLTAVDASTPGSSSPPAEAAPAPWAKPLVVVVSGAVDGIGLALATCADVLLATPDASFVLPPADAAGAARETLVRCSSQLPYRLVTALTMARRPLSAERAHEVGFVNELADADAIEAVARRWAESLAAVPPDAAAAIREAATEGLGEDLAAAIAGRYAAVERYAASADAAEAVAALLEGRRPLWRGH